MKKIVAVLFVFQLFGAETFSQNLVPDSSFEIKANCPYTLSEIHKLKYWWSPTSSTPDYFCNCEKGKWKNSVVEASDNFIGHQEPRTGLCYAGFIVYQASAKDYREYIQTKLIYPLEKGEKYNISFYLSIGDYCKYQIDSTIGVYFSKDSIFYNTKYKLNLKPQVSSKGVLENNSKGWFLVSGIYEAKGGEQFIIIGRFNTIKPKIRKSEKPTQTQHGEKLAYYYIDDVSVCEIKNAEEKKEIIIPVVKELEVNKTYVLKNLNFETKSSVILPSSFAELDATVSFFKKNDSLKIELRGHTDNTGDEKSNQQLSEERAKAVADYFISKGIEAKRISYKGYGSSKPVAPNDTEEGKAKNRRVEFLISN